MFKFILDVRRQLAHYRDYIVLLNTGMEAAEDKIAQLEADNARLRALVEAVDVRHYKRIINCLEDKIDEQEAKIAELESEIEDLQDEYGDYHECEEIQYPDDALLNILEEAGIDPARCYSVGTLLDIKDALQSVWIA